MRTLLAIIGVVCVSLLWTRFSPLGGSLIVASFTVRTVCGFERTSPDIVLISTSITSGLPCGMTIRSPETLRQSGTGSLSQS
jgi:hypothetical protein